MLFGFFIRRIVTVTVCAASFWLGMKTERLIEPKPAAAKVAADCPEAPNGN
ncbi:hypothetical protein DEA8626_00142 [Defluviimonas aquaemixtae]|uniref:Uncharacterized protein n=1 Tax=Albidovulum aquaemixtae TaxID=1542388 RepID=A0A2R8B257_9RHOB|nr:hypothetical protein [Defluviimonas aquaemixtae]SPH16632.1 hypothetical protein DEA8626_00142 [Defluviimonas aquaemixtae]